MNLPNSHTSPGHGGEGGAFATTHWSLVLHASQGDDIAAREALESLCRNYWPAIYAYVRRSGQTTEAARDLTQSYFARLLDKGLIGVADRRKGRFRTFLLTVLQRFLADQYAHDTAAKRGGGDLLLSVDELADEEERQYSVSHNLTPEKEFDRRWALATLDNALRHLRAEVERSGRGDLFEALQDHLGGGDPDRTLAELGASFDLQEGALKTRLCRWRARYRELIRQEVAHTVPELADLEEEMNHLIAALAE